VLTHDSSSPSVGTAVSTDNVAALAADHAIPALHTVRLSEASVALVCVYRKKQHTTGDAMGELRVLVGVVRILGRRWVYL